MFGNFLDAFSVEDLLAKTIDASAEEVSNVLNKQKISLTDLPVLLSTAAGHYLEQCAKRSREITKRRFGNIIQLYIPLYLSSKCSNACIYCGFRSSNPIARITLSPAQVFNEADEIFKMGFRNILLVSGATSEILEKNYLHDIVRKLSGQFTSVSIETEPLNELQYRELEQAGLDGVTLYQETYNRDLYSKIHPGGSKRDYSNRLNALDRAGKAGIRKLGIGILLGLHDYRLDALLLGLHCSYLIKHYWQSSIAVSFPRIRENESNYKPEFPISDRELAQIIFAFRMVFPDNDLVLSTRERPEIRNLLATMGITYMSAGSRTSPGAYSLHADTGKQFELEDTRTVAEICAALQANGIDPVWKDWNGNNLHHE
jgi:2-iminoacetate synthase